MPLPFLAAAALAKLLALGGTVVPHVSGGLIGVLGGKYVAGTFLSAATVAAIKKGGAAGGLAGLAVLIKRLMR